MGDILHACSAALSSNTHKSINWGEILFKKWVEMHFDKAET